jgi:hypothetical protein
MVSRTPTKPLVVLVWSSFGRLPSLVWFSVPGNQVGALLASSEHPSSPPTLKVWDPAQSSKRTETELGLQIGGRLLIATQLDQSNHLPNQRHGTVNKYGDY